MAWDGLFIAPPLIILATRQPTYGFLPEKKNTTISPFLGKTFSPAPPFVISPRDRSRGNCAGLTSSKATTFWLPHNQWTESALEAVLIRLHAYTALGMTLSLSPLCVWVGSTTEKERKSKKERKNCNYLITAVCCTGIGIPECNNRVVLLERTGNVVVPWKLNL